MWSIVMNLTITVVNSVTKRPTKLSWENTWVSNMVMTLTITCVTSVTIKATDKAFLGRHMNVKHGNDCDNNSCQLCDYKSHDKSFLRKHMNFKHYKEVSKETFCCDICYACPVHGTWTGRGTGQGNGSGERVKGALIFNFQKTTAYGGLQALKYTAGGAELETRWRQETAFQKMLLYEEIETGLASL